MYLGSKPRQLRIAVQSKQKNMRVLVLFWCLLSLALSNEDLEEFGKLFQQKRLHQLTAVKQLLNMSPENQLKLLESMMNKMTNVLKESQTILSQNSLDLTQGKLPEEQKDRTALALVLENTCLASDILLRFPDFMLKKLAKDKEFELIYKWGLGFINETVNFVMDEATKRLFFLAGQELKLSENSDPNYVNPYKKPKNEPKKIMFADPPKVEKKQKKKLKKGPRMSKSEL